MKKTVKNILFLGINYNSIELESLNEGITAYKQEMYDKFIGIKPRTPYQAEKEVAKFIGQVIGKDKLISMHFNHDYQGIRSAFTEKTGRDLNELTEKLNQQSNVLTKFFGKLYTKHFSKKMEKFMEEFDIKQESKERNTDFIPKVNVDYTEIRENAQENQPQQHRTNNVTIERDGR